MNITNLQFDNTTYDTFYTVYFVTFVVLALVTYDILLSNRTSRLDLQRFHRCKLNAKKINKKTIVSKVYFVCMNGKATREKRLLAMIEIKITISLLFSMSLE